MIWEFPFHGALAHAGMVRAVSALITEQSQQGPKARFIPAWSNAPGKARSPSQNKG